MFISDARADLLTGDETPQELYEIALARCESNYPNNFGESYVHTKQDCSHIKPPPPREFGVLAIAISFVLLGSAIFIYRKLRKKKYSKN